MYIGYFAGHIIFACRTFTIIIYYTLHRQTTLQMVLCVQQHLIIKLLFNYCSRCSSVVVVVVGIRKYIHFKIGSSENGLRRQQ
jgi:hypothetical protein